MLTATPGKLRVASHCIASCGHEGPIYWLLRQKHRGGKRAGGKIREGHRFSRWEGADGRGGGHEQRGGADHGARAHRKLGQGGRPCDAAAAHLGIVPLVPDLGDVNVHPGARQGARNAGFWSSR